MNEDTFLVKIELPATHGQPSRRLDLCFSKMANRISNLKITNECLVDLANLLRDYGMIVTYENFEEPV